MCHSHRAVSLNTLTALLLNAMLGYCAVSQAEDMGHQMHGMADNTHNHAMEMQASAGPHAQHPGDPHAQHRQAMEQIGYSRTYEHYALPHLDLVTMQGERVPVAKLLDSDQPIALNFIFTSCTTICPIMSATFAQAQKKLGDEAQHIHWISISIDPEFDTPERLREYAHQFKAGSQWSFLTGATEDIVTLQRAFDVYRGDKMNHIPVTLLRANRDAPWVRLNGLTSGTELVSEYHQLAHNH